MWQYVLPAMMGVSLFGNLMQGLGNTIWGNEKRVNPYNPGIPVAPMRAPTAPGVGSPPGMGSPGLSTVPTGGSVTSIPRLALGGSPMPQIPVSPYMRKY